MPEPPGGDARPFGPGSRKHERGVAELGDGIRAITREPHASACDDRGPGGAEERSAAKPREHRTAPRMISVEHLTKYYGATRAVDDVSFEIARGERAALLGPNGSGKSTLLRMVTGYFSPTGGRVVIGGVDMGGAPLAARRRVGYLPEQVSLYPELTVRRTLAFVAEVRGVRRGTRRGAVDEVIAGCGLTEVADRRVGTLSKGYRQRVGLAQALVGDPDVLVLDEPTVGLDPVQTVEMRGLLCGLTGRTVLLSTHILAEASALCSRIVILDRGRLLAEDTPEGLGRRLEALGRLVVRVEGPAGEVTSALAALPGVLRVEAMPPDALPGARFVLLGPSLGPVQRQIGPAVVGRGWTLLEVRAETPTLEDLFVRLVRPSGHDGGR
ncbi:MAG: ABC transporter ATP-binding protein [Deltaproteobacteria bacterium]|nr:MAG: ABC transporter ATP-binding protein [Deltaproteobacteria bacterium]